MSPLIECFPEAITYGTWKIVCFHTAGITSIGGGVLICSSRLLSKRARYRVRKKGQLVQAYRRLARVF